MKTRILILICLFYISNSLVAQDLTYNWVVGIGGTNYEESKSIVTDNAGNIYFTGYFEGIVDFDPGSGINNLTSNGLSETDLFIVKLDASGNLAWARNTGGIYAEYSYSMTYDSQGYIYITGVFYDTADFDPGPGTYNLIGHGGSTDAFVLKLDTSGNFVWAKSFGGLYTTRSYSIVTDESGNVCVTGWFKGSVDFDPGNNTYDLTSNGNYDIFILKLDAAGNFLWAKTLGGAGSDYGYSIAVDDSGNVYSTGQFSGYIDLDPGNGTHYTVAYGDDDIFVLKLDALGNYVWAKHMGGNSETSGMSMVLDHIGYIYITGYFQGTTDFDPSSNQYNLSSNGTWDIFVLKLDNYGNLIWAKKMGGNNNDFGYSLVLDASGHVYTTGKFSNTVDFDPGNGTFNLTSNGQYDIFISKLDSSGNFIGAYKIGSTLEDVSSCIANDVNGNIYITGYFRETIDFNPGNGIANLSSNGFTDIFVLKFTQLQADFIASITSVVVGDTIYFSDLSIGEPTSWVWNFGDGATSNSQSPFHMYQTSGDYTVSLDISNGNESSTMIKQNYISVIDQIAIGYTQQNVNCFNGSDGMIDLNVSGIYPPFVYTWSNGSTQEDLDNLAVGWYHVTVTDNTGLSVVDSILLSQPNEMIITAFIENISNQMATGSINVSVLGGTPPYDFLWSNNSTSNPLIVNDAGTYNLTVTDNHSCTLDTAFQVLIGIHEINIVNSFTIFPNPFSNFMQVKYSLSHPTKIQLAIFSTDGHLVSILEEGNKNTGDHQVIWGVNNIKNTQHSSGIYFLKLRTTDEIFIHKVVLNRN